MTKPIPKFLTREEMTTVDQVARHMRGEQIPNPEYAKARNAALAAAGLEPEPVSDTFDPENASVQDHIDRIQRSR